MTAPTLPPHFLPNTDPRFSVLRIEEDAETGKVWTIREEPVIGWRIMDDPAPDTANLFAPETFVMPLHASSGSTWSAGLPGPCIARRAGAARQLLLSAPSEWAD
jgi:hypothetical protein